MERPPRVETGRGPGTRLALAAAVLLTLLAVVSVASRGGLGRGGRGPAPDHALLDRLFTALFVLWLLYIPVAIWIYWQQQRRRIGGEAPRRRSTLASILTYAAFLLAVVLLVRLRAHLGIGGSEQGATVPTLPKPIFGTTTAAPQRYEPQFDRQAALLVLGVAAAAIGAVAWFWLRGRKTAGAKEPAVAEQLSLALDDSLDDVLAERDPRRAVIAAYARMERVLGAAGLPRAPHEAPFEFVGRALLALAVSEGAVRRLTALFERARFSTHEIDEDMRGEAIAALTQVRDELREAE